MQYYFEGKTEWDAGKRAQYMNKLTRNQASTIFRARTRMLKVKANFKKGHTNLECRMCGNKEETLKHILEECMALQKETPSITKKMIFEENIIELTQTEKWIKKLSGFIQISIL